LRVCETFGRFALHKEAVSGVVGVTFSEQASLLLKWTTAVVVPALMLSDSKKAPFNDPNLSHISVEQSFDFPVSPAVTGPARRRSKRDKTPKQFSRGGSSFDSPGSATSDDPPFILANSFAISLMQSCVFLFSEWLAVGGSGSEEIAAAATSWTKIFTTDAPEGSDPYKLLVPAFCRLALCLCKTAENFALLEKLILSISEEIDENEKGPMQLVLASLLSTRGNDNAVVKSVIRCVLDAVYARLQAVEDFVVSADSAPSIGLICPEDESGCVVLALRCALSSKQGSIELANSIVDSFAVPTTMSDNEAMFNAQCLSMIHNAPLNGDASPDVSSILRRLDIGRLDPETAFQPILQNLHDSLVE